ncbi:hypothetical protein [Treponema bryantii]|uniref:hypothetical protein n=1 Tax=Treponema bryantii TaxID=163 RepID=UPI002B2936B7|nr:hypothetical protein TRBR_22930 [Treponema bryantii]
MMNPDCQLLKDFYVKVFETESYRNFAGTDDYIYEFEKKLIKTEGLIKILSFIILFAIYLSLILFFRGAYKKIIILPLLIVALIITKIFQKTYKSKIKAAYKKLEIYRKEVQDIAAQTENPPLPDDKFTPEHFNNLIAVFESGRADNLKEALITYDQDLKHNEKIEELRNIRSAINSYHYYYI